MKIIKFGAPWCPSCKTQDRELDKLEGIEVQKVNVDEDTALAEKYGVRNLPTILLFDSEEVIKKFTGYTKAETIKEFL